MEMLFAFYGDRAISKNGKDNKKNKNENIHKKRRSETEIEEWDNGTFVWEVGEVLRMSWWSCDEKLWSL